MDKFRDFQSNFTSDLFFIYYARFEKWIYHPTLKLIGIKTIHFRWGLFFLIFFQFVELEKDKTKDPHFRIYISINSEVR